MKNKHRYALQIVIALLLAAALFSFKAKGQSNIGVGLTNNGAAVYAGYLVGNTDISFAYSTPLFSTEKPTVMSLSVGRLLVLFDNDISRLALTPSIGISSVRYKDFSQYHIAPEYKIIEVKEYKPIYGLELGYDKGMGRLFVSGNYSKNFCAAIGIKVFIYR